MTPQESALALREADRRVLAGWAADCAERAVARFEAETPGDGRPRDAIDGARAYARGELDIDAVAPLAAAAHAAARDAAEPAAEAGARAAGHAAAVAHMAAHARGAVAYAALAAGLATPTDPAAGESELRRAVDHASPAAREALRRLPPPPAAASTLGKLLSDLHRMVSTGPSGGV